MVFILFESETSLINDYLRKKIINNLIYLLVF